MLRVISHRVVAASSLLLLALTSSVQVVSAASALHAAATTAATEPSSLSYGFSECIDNKRTLFYYSDTTVTCANSSASTDDIVIAKPPVHGLRCDVPCERGYFLGANFSGPTPVSGCEKCETGKYSLGGGKLFSKRTAAWSSPLPIDLHTDCVTRNMFTGKWQANCAAWNASTDGAFIASGDNSDIMARFEAARLFATLRLSATFVRDGSVTYQFRVDAEAPVDGLIFTIDDTAVTPLISTTDGSWSEASFAVAAGAHTFSWDYTKDYAGDAGADKAYIKVIEVVGTAFADTQCHACGGDMTMHGGSLCAFCGKNEFAAAKSHSELDFACYKCPQGTIAPTGSIGKASCVEKRACTTDDVVEKLTDCRSGQRNATFAWSDPLTCDPTLHDSIALPQAQHHVACAACPIGFVVAASGNCAQCPMGQYVASNANACTTCPVGQVPVNALAFGIETPSGWSHWPSIVDVTAAIANGWKLTRNGIAFSNAQAVKEDDAWSQPQRFVLPFNTTFVHAGVVNVTYALRHVPTFDSAGVRAWLELEIMDRDGHAAGQKTKQPRGDVVDSDDDDDDNNAAALRGDIGGSIAHLLHGGENGTFSEAIAINVTRRTTKQFALVLRTTSPEAATLIHVKILGIAFVGTQQGGAVACASCPLGFEAIDADSDDSDDDDSDNNNVPGCRLCPAGTFAASMARGTTCTTCPPNTFSAVGTAGACAPCGRNTFSAAGAHMCSAPAILHVLEEAPPGSRTTNASATSNATVDAGASLPSYDLAQLESLIWGNESFLFSDAAATTARGAPTAATLLSTAAVLPSGAIKIDATHIVFVGLFRPVDPSWRDEVLGQLVEDDVDDMQQQLVDDNVRWPYVVALTMRNPRDAGHFFAQMTSRYGEVECAAPAQWGVSSGGSRMDITAFANGTGVQVHYTDGSNCARSSSSSDRVRASTLIQFVCDLSAGTTVAPSASARDDATCTTTIVWRTALACPICDASDVSELRSACSGGAQSIAFRRTRPCYGGAVLPASIPVAMCNDVVLDTQAQYTMYAAISLVGIVVFVLLAAVFVTHRKYRATYNEYMYLKGRMPTTVATTADGANETTFEFANANGASSPAAPSPDTASPSTRPPTSNGRDGKNDDDEEHKRADNEDASGVELSVRSV